MLLIKVLAFAGGVKQFWNKLVIKSKTKQNSTKREKTSLEWK